MGTDMCVCPISRRLNKKFGLKSYQPAVKQRPTSEMKKKIWSSAYKHLHGTVEEWEKVLFSDESTVCSAEEARAETKLAKF